MSMSEAQLRKRSWREIRDREIHGLHDSAQHLEDLEGAHSEAIELLPFTELGEELMDAYRCDPAHWRLVLPIIIVARIEATIEGES